jgi:hypothetical protein
MLRNCILFCFIFLLPAQLLARPNTSYSQLGAKDMANYLQSFRQSPEAMSLYPLTLRTESATKAADPKCVTLLLFFKSSDPDNQVYVANFLNLWLRQKNKVNFVLIDLDEAFSYYATILLREYWKDEALKILALSPSGKIRIQLTNPRDLPQLEADLNKLTAEFASEK